MAVNRLGLAALARIPAEARPRVTPGDAGTGIVHIGLGAFYRAHQAVYTEAAMAAAGGDWGTVAVAPRSRPVADAVNAQDGLFTVTELSADGERTRVVGSVNAARHLPDDPDGIVALLADPAVGIVTLTVTEKAYGDQAAIPGLLARGLTARARTGAPLAVVSCDNLPGNGGRLRAAVLRRLALSDAADQVLDWIDGHVAFPATAVDRIVPASTEATYRRVADTLGVTDGAAVDAEPYAQWVLQDRFPAGRPAWELAGAVLTDDVTPWEDLKLRTLNGVHSTLAYLGALAGCDTIAETLSLPGMEATMRRLIAEDVAPGLTPPPGVSAVDYGEEVLARFANPGIAHRTIQIAMDGSQKLPQRILRTITERRATGGRPVWAALSVAAWIRYTAGTSDTGEPLVLDDPLAGAITDALASANGSTAAAVEAVFGLREIFPAALAEDSEVRELVADWLGRLARHGAADVVRGSA
ncbi:mannitol dehydrogenase family protein [Phytomonospora endophytica]|uniref:Mannitol-1-phosphate 5-dehydrogenase n=1 Tax=Phytomonospora endophytica TaxID=714109 RepID=A0A841FH90_9ACTN|nr:mannitol dehydrogenase family protein [Phytomonospora endophytica]MBB6034353.1 fructuronate reductase [Phytomonospora endophytica]GIG66746.1 mannitol dehydrogenase [Phytomonospora endophytica]